MADEALASLRREMILAEFPLHDRLGLPLELQAVAVLRLSVRDSFVVSNHARSQTFCLHASAVQRRMRRRHATTPSRYAEFIAVAVLAHDPSFSLAAVTPAEHVDVSIVVAPVLRQQT